MMASLSALVMVSHVCRFTYLDISLGKETELAGRCVTLMSVI